MRRAPTPRQDPLGCRSRSADAHRPRSSFFGGTLMLRHIGFAVVSLVLLAGARAQVTSASAAPHQVFGTPVVTAVGAPSDVDFGDFDEDGHADLLATAPAGLQRAYGSGD